MLKMPDHTSTTTPEVSSSTETEATKMESLLTQSDLTWLNKLSMNEVGEDDLSGINELILADVSHLNYVKGAQEADARDARTLFYEDVLGWNNEESPYKTTYAHMQKQLKTSSEGPQNGRPVAQFIATVRKIDEFGIDLARTARSARNLLLKSPEALQNTYKMIEEIGFDADEMISLVPSILGSSSEMIQKRFTDISAYFDSRGVNAHDLIKRAPFIMDFQVEAIDEKLQNLTNLGLDANWLIKTKPTIISQSADSVRQRFVFLAEHGLNAAKLIGRAPSVLEYSDERIEASVIFMESVGLDVPKVTFSAPTMLCLSTANIQEKLDNLKELGLNSVAVINRSPTVATYNVETIKSKMIFIDGLLETLDTPVTAAKLIQCNPDLLSRDVNGLFIAAQFAQVQAKSLDTPQLVSSAFSKSVDETVLRTIKNFDGVEVKLPTKAREYHAQVVEYLENPVVRNQLGKLSLNTLLNHENAKGAKYLGDAELKALKGSMAQSGDSSTPLPIVAPDDRPVEPGRN